MKTVIYLCFLISIYVFFKVMYLLIFAPENQKLQTETHNY